MKYILLSLVWAVITIGALMPIKGEYLSWGELFRTVWEWRQGWINHLWFIGALVCIYLVFPLLKLVFDYNKKYFVYFICVCLIMTFGNNFLNMVFNVFEGLRGNNYVVDINFFNMFNPFRDVNGWILVYFCCGGLLGYYHESIVSFLKLKKKEINIICNIAMIFSCTVLCGYGIYVSFLTNQRWDVVWNGYDTIFTLINVATIYLLSLNYAEKNMDYLTFYIETISKNTLGIFFMHEIFIRLTIDFVIDLGFSRNVIGNVVYAMCVALMCIVIILLLKKIPIVKKLIS